MDIWLLVQRTPGGRLHATLLAGLCAVVGLVLIASLQPRFGMTYTVDATGVRVTGAPVAAAGLPKGARMVAVGGRPPIAVDATTLTAEPGMLPSYAAVRAFMDEQDRIARRMRAAPSLIVTAERGARVIPLRQHRRLPAAAFWFQIAVGFVGFAISAWIWALAPRSLPNLLFGLSGCAMLAFAGSAGVYSTRELGMELITFRLLTVVNEVGAAVFGMALAALFLVYPRRIAAQRTIAALAMVFAVWTMLGVLRLMPSPALGGNAATAAEMLVIVAAIVGQFFATRGDPVGRSALRWLGIATLAGAGGFIATSTVPVVLGLPPLLDQGSAFAFFLVIHAGIAVGLRRDRLFALEPWSFSLLFYGAAAAIFVSIDLLLVMLLHSLPGASAITALLMLPLLYLPARDWLTRRLVGTGLLDPSRVLEDVARLSFIGEAEVRARLWRESLQRAFAPLTLSEGAPVRSVDVLDHGAAMAIPAVAGAPPLLLGLSRRGASLFGPADRGLAERMVALAARADSDRLAHERGVHEERARVSRDLHDDLAARLMNGLMSDDSERLRGTIRDALAEVRAIVSGVGGSAMNVSDVLADTRVEAAERLHAAGLQLVWQPTSLPGTIEADGVKALTSAVRELVTNVIRHAGATRVRVAVRQDGDRLHLRVEDDGEGCSDRAASGNGLRNVVHRLNAVGGTASFERGGGFAAALSLPVRDAR